MHSPTTLFALATVASSGRGECVDPRLEDDSADVLLLAGEFQGHPYAVRIAEGQAEPLDRGYALRPSEQGIEMTFARPGRN